MPKRKKANHNGELRIIAGQWRGRKLAIADIPGLRPTGDRIRETLFNWLMPYIPGSRCLDLFSGSGALAFEGLSRGANSAVMVEKHPAAARQLAQHCEQLKAPNAKVIQEDSLEWLINQPLEEQSIDLVFIDPPFANDLWDEAINKLSDSNILTNDALIYIEAPKGKAISTPEYWQLHKHKQAGDISYYLYRCES